MDGWMDGWMDGTQKQNLLFCTIQRVRFKSRPVKNSRRLVSEITATPSEPSVHMSYVCQS